RRPHRLQSRRAARAPPRPTYETRPTRSRPPSRSCPSRTVIGRTSARRRPRPRRRTDERPLASRACVKPPHGGIVLLVGETRPRRRTEMDAIDLASEIKRARNVAARHAAYATNGDGAEWDDPQMVAHMWQQSAARHAARAEYLT